MVGNDPVNDMCAVRAGIKTYLTTDGEVMDYASLPVSHTIRDGFAETDPPHGRGSILDLPRFIAGV
jgi:hypothetical protein